ncbi:histone H1-like repetitive region-containing protein [Micromonospora arborensis]|uniref:histone H1-like repetitive region-containing protein n=1 Tax=Micromonospora arborensis TaxID=2116518 RepID=UPI00370F92F6
MTAAKKVTAAKKTTAATRTTAAKKATAVRKSTGARKTAPATRSTAATKSTTARTGPARKAAAKKAPARPAAKRATPAKRTTAKRAAPAKRTTAKRAAPAKRTTAKRAAPAKRTTVKRAASPSGGSGMGAVGIRTGRGTGRSVRSSQVISSVSDRPERPGRSLITANHEVIQRWARERGAKPATIAGTERDGRAGVLTFNIPGYRESSRIREITWDDWFYTFDLRRLNLIYQEQLRDGRQSNFFRTESPDREDG